MAHRSSRKFIAIPVAVVAVLALVAFIVWRFEGTSSSDSNNTLAAAPVPSDSWSNGISQTWSLDVGLEDADEIFTSPDFLVVAFARTTAEHQAGTIMTWDVTGSKPELLFSGEPEMSIVSGSSGNAGILGRYLVVGNRTMDIRSGEVSSAPWTGAEPIFFGNSLVASCETSDLVLTCTSFGTDLRERASADVHLAGAPVSSAPLASGTAAKMMFCDTLQCSIVDLLSGQTTDPDVSLDNGALVRGLRDGWLVAESEENPDPLTYAVSSTGDVLTDTDETAAPPYLLSGPALRVADGGVMTLDDAIDMSEEVTDTNGQTTVITPAGSACTRVAVNDGPPIKDSRNLWTRSSGKCTVSPSSTVFSSSDGSALFFAQDGPLGPARIEWILNTQTSETIWRASPHGQHDETAPSARLLQPDLLLVIDRESGEINAYDPAP